MTSLPSETGTRQVKYGEGSLTRGYDVTKSEKIRDFILLS